MSDHKDGLPDTQLYRPATYCPGPAQPALDVFLELRTVRHATGVQPQHVLTITIPNADLAPVRQLVGRKSTTQLLFDTHLILADEQPPDPSQLELVAFFITGTVDDTLGRVIPGRQTLAQLLREHFELLKPSPAIHLVGPSQGATVVVARELVNNGEGHWIMLNLPVGVEPGSQPLNAWQPAIAMYGGRRLQWIIDGDHWTLAVQIGPLQGSKAATQVDDLTYALAGVVKHLTPLGLIPPQVIVREHMTQAR